MYSTYTHIYIWTPDLLLFVHTCIYCRHTYLHKHTYTHMLHSVFPCSKLSLCVHQKIWDGSDWCQIGGIKIGVKTIHCEIFRSRWWIDSTVLFIPMFSVTRLSLAVNAPICHLACVCHCDVEGIRHIMSRLSHSNVELLSTYILHRAHVKLTSPFLLSASRVRLLFRQTYIYICLRLSECIYIYIYTCINVYKCHVLNAI